MEQEKSNELIRRTDRKLKFAAKHLNAITNRGKELSSGDDFEIDHEECFFFHLVGAKDAFLQEINVAYQVRLKPRQVNERRLLYKLTAKKRVSPELATIIELEESGESRLPITETWLAVAIEFRNEGAHRQQTSRNVELPVGSYARHTYTYPFGSKHKRKPMEITIPEFLELCLDKMKKLLDELRATLAQIEC